MPELRSLSPTQCAELIQNAHFIVALTGAGISTSAGIPDFRGPRGLYVTRRYDPEKVFEIGAFNRAPQHFYEFSNDFVAEVKNVQPTLTHKVLAELERQGPLAGVITQNVDQLHQLAGNQKVVELHGSYSAALCQSCGRRFKDLSYGWWEQTMNDSVTPPVAHCSKCTGVIKPDIVFFGEQVNGYEEAERMVSECDLLLVLGSSLQVTPASILPYSTKAATVVVNQGAVALPSAPHRYFVASDLDSYFRQVATCLGQGG